MKGEEECPALHLYISALTWCGSVPPTADERARGLEALEVLLQAGARWSLADEDVKHLRQYLTEGEARVVRPLVELLRRYEVFTPDEFRKLTEPPAVKKVLKGISKPKKQPRAIGAALPVPPS
jgi:hypothetical protein